MLIQGVHAQYMSLAPAKLVAHVKVEYEDFLILQLNHCIVFTSSI